MGSYSKAGTCRRSRSILRPPALVDPLESRLLLAVHVMGSATVYSTIQAAVNAAPVGGTVRVDPGSYPESVLVKKSLTIDGAQAGVDARGNQRWADNSESVVSGKALSDGTVSGAFYVTANNVTIDGFTIQGSTSFGTDAAGIVLGPNINGSRVLNNILQNNVSGLFLSNNSSTNPAIIQYNVFRNNNHNGANGGRGIYTDGSISGGNLTNVTIDSNVFQHNLGGAGTTGLEAAIALESETPGSQSNIRVTNNVMDDNGKGVLAFNASGLDIQHNVLTHCHDFWSGALRFEGNDSNVNIQYNTMFNNQGYALRIDSKGYPGDSSNFTITHNNFYNNSYQYWNHVAFELSQYTGPLDARYNWWGSPLGPSTTWTGAGDVVITAGYNVMLSNWSTTPVGTIDTPYEGLPFSADARIDAEYFDEGGEGIAYHDQNAFTTGPFRQGTGIDCENTADNGGYDVTNTAPGEWLNYTVTVPQTGTYTLNLRVANGQSVGGTLHFELDGQNVTDPIQLPYTGGAQGWQTITRAGVQLSAGQHVLKLAFDAAGSDGQFVGNVNWFSFTPTGASALPAAPSNLSALAAGPTAVNLTWTDNSNNEIHFVVERQTGSSGTWQTIATLPAGSVAYTDGAVGAGLSYTYRVHATNSAGSSANSNLATVTTPQLPTVTYVSDLPFATTPINGWGPVERDMSVGGSGAGDGNPITLKGVVYAKGLGVHAVSDVAFNLGGAYATFTSDIGIDDEESVYGSVVFQVYADGVKVYDGGLITRSSPTQTVTVSMSGVQQLRLHVTDGGDGIDYDHADWAGARLLASAAAPTPPAAPGNLAASIDSADHVRLAWVDNSNNETGFKIERSTDGVNFAQIATVGANVATYTDSTAAAGTTYFYRVRATAGSTDSAYSNVASVAVPAAPAATYLSDVAWVSATIGWGTVQKDLSVAGNPLTLRGVTYAKGIGTHAVSQIVYNIGGQYSSFVSDVGIDDEEIGRGTGSVDFQVIGDGKVLFDSGVVTNVSPVVHMNVSVVGVQQLTLVANNGVAGSIDYDHADWAGAELTRASAAAVAPKLLPNPKLGLRRRLVRRVL